MQTIDIRTTQNVTIEYELASLRDRGLAFFIDFLIFGAIYIALLLMLMGAFGSVLLEAGMLLYVLYGLLPVVGLMAYQFLSEVLANGQSWGKRAIGIKVVRIDGQEAGLSDYFLRAVFLLMDFTFSFGVLATLLISSSPKNQRLGDMTANTTVIRTRAGTRFQLQDILRISSIEDYTPQYPEVRRLSEQDMLLLKHLLARQRQYNNSAHDTAVKEAAERLRIVLDLPEVPKNKTEFLKTLIRDYIVLTR